MIELSDGKCTICGGDMKDGVCPECGPQASAADSAKNKDPLLQTPEAAQSAQEALDAAQQQEEQPTQGINLDFSASPEAETEFGTVEEELLASPRPQSPHHTIG